MNLKNWYEVVSIGVLAGVLGAVLGGAPITEYVAGLTTLGCFLWVVR